MPRPVRCVLTAALALCLITSAASASSLPAGMTWSGDLSPSNFSQYSFVEQCPGDVSDVVGSPAPANVHAAELRVSDGDNNAACPGHVFTPNPAASLISPTVFHNGDDAWIGFSVYFPAGFPTIPNWFQFAELYGAPFGGSPPVGLDIQGNRMGLWRDATHNFDNPWSTPVVTGRWQDFVLHVKFSPDPSVGFVELWLNGVQQQFSDGSTRLYYSTLVTGNNWDGASGGDSLDLDQYRSKLDHLGTVTIYEAEPAIGTSQAAVAPQLHYGIASAPTATPGSSAPAPTPLPKPSTKPAAKPTAHSSSAKHPAKRVVKHHKKRKRHKKRHTAPKSHKKRAARRPASGSLLPLPVSWLRALGL